jgi:putative addiction module component (TIGR02574 family)
MEPTAVFQEIATWPLEDRLELIERVWDDLVDSGWQPPLTEAQRAELDRRLGAAQANPDDVVSWEDIVHHVRRPR